MPATILIVDDESHIRLLIEEALEPLENDGIEILTAEDGVAAMEIIRARRPDLIVLDVMMPRMNGFEVCGNVKSDPALEGARIIMLTAKGQEFDKTRGENAGVDLYMTKPFDPDELYNRAVELLRLKL